MDVKVVVEQVVVKVFPDGRMDTVNAANYLGLEPKTLAMKRTYGRGPKFIKRGRIFYFKEDLDAWINEHDPASSTAQLKASVK